MIFNKWYQSFQVPACGHDDGPSWCWGEHGVAILLGAVTGELHDVGDQGASNP
jgi:hypothetical protein